MFILLLLSTPGSVFPRFPAFLDLFRPDKLVHLVLFGIYGWLRVRGLSKQSVFTLLKDRAVLFTLIFGSSLGLITEIMQRYWIPLRTGSIYDLIVDIAGCALGAVIYKRTVNSEQ